MFSFNELNKSSCFNALKDPSIYVVTEYSGFLSLWQPCDGFFFSVYFKRAPNRLTRKKCLSNRSIRIHSPLLSTSFPPPLLLAVGGLPGFPRRAKTNNSAKQGSIRPGSGVTLASHLPGRGLTSQAASRALSWTSSA